MSINTDLALELRTAAMEKRAKSDVGEIDGIAFSEEHLGDITISSIDILNDIGAKKLKKPIGRYITISFGDICNTDIEGYKALCRLVAKNISALSDIACPKAESVLVCGLGNSHFSADAIGTVSVEHTMITRHIKEHDDTIFKKADFFDICAITPGVTAQTGMETLEIVRGAVACAAPDLIIAVDSLAARETRRLACTIQLSDTGISPGSGVGNHRAAIDKKTTGVPTISVGVPMVIDSSTMITDALMAAGIDKVADLPRGMFVCPRDVDLKVRLVGSLIGYAINTAFHKGIGIEDMMIM